MISDHVLTFTDTNGKLMALKPDVTLSIVKNVPTASKEVRKVCYNESVYRPSNNGDGFREIMHTGVECIGCLDLYAEGEVLMLAMESLKRIGQTCVLDISHTGLLEGVLAESGCPEQAQEALIRMIESKNLPAIRKACAELELSESACDVLCRLTSMYLPLGEAVVQIAELVQGAIAKRACEQLKQLESILAEYGLSQDLYFDFSLISDVHYYDGVIFKGFVSGISESVLSGGRYDRLLHRLGKGSSVGAIGFAVYLDRLARYGTAEPKYDADVLLVYDESSDMKALIAEVRRLQADGMLVRTSLTADAGVRCRQVISFGKGGEDSFENHD